MNIKARYWMAAGILAISLASCMGGAEEKKASAPKPTPPAAKTPAPKKPVPPPPPAPAAEAKEKAPEPVLSLPPIKEGPQNSLIGIKVMLRSALKREIREADMVYFVRIRDGAGFAEAKDLFPADCVKGGYAYLIDAVPGRYAVAAAHETVRREAASANRQAERKSYDIKYITFFSEGLLRSTEVAVGPGEAAFIGEFTVDEASFEKTDPAQEHFFSLLKHDCGDLSSVKRLILIMAGEYTAGDYCYRGEPHTASKERQLKIDFLFKSEPFLAGTEWARIVTESARGLINSPERQ